MAKNIAVVCMDGSKYADYAFDYYLQSVHHADDTVILLHCADYRVPANVPIGMGSGELVAKMLEEEKQKTDAYLKVLLEKFFTANLQGKVELCYGDPGHVLLEKAQEEGATLVVTGNRGQGTFKRTLFGSVSDYILHHAHIPVLVCKQSTH